MHQSYRVAIAYFTIFGALLLLSGALLFASKLGLTVESIKTFYLGSATGFAQPKSSYGLLETALPHLGAMGLFIFVLGHFLLFAPKKEKRKAIFSVITLFLAAFFDIISGFCMIQGWEFFVFVKITSFLMLQGVALYLLFIVFKNTLSGIQKHRLR